MINITSKVNNKYNKSMSKVNNKYYILNLMLYSGKKDRSSIL